MGNKPICIDLYISRHSKKGGRGHTAPELRVRARASSLWVPEKSLEGGWDQRTHEHLETAEEVNSVPLCQP